MTATLSRLILAMTVLMFVVFAFFPIALVLDAYIKGQDEIILLVTCIVDVILLVAGWIWVWHREVRWTKHRKRITALSCLLCLIPAAAVGGAMAYVIPYAEEAWFIFSGIMWSICWIGSTAVIWRETAEERVERLKMLGINAIACPNCGYNMTGLKQAECPECGAKYTLDQLYAAMKDVGV